MGIPIDRVPSPSPSLISEREREESERAERELELKRKRLQVYVFICRCIACPFNSKQSSDMARKHLKITLIQYGVIKDRFLAFLNGKTHIEADEGNLCATRLSVLPSNHVDGLSSFHQCRSILL
jgi:calcium-dependent secretion activator